MRSASFGLSLLLTTTLFAAALAGACGGSAPPASAPAAPVSSAPTAPPETAAPTAPPAATSSSAATNPAAPATGPAANVDIVPSKMIADIKAIGIDLDKAGDLSKLELPKKRKLMPFFVKALGMSGCEGCHVPGDFKASTHDKDMASAMWSHFVRDLRMKGGGALFCDSCHQSKQKLLARGDKKAVAAFMQSNYEDKLQRANKKDHTCETCHSDPFEGKIFAKLWKVAPG
jgi:hypothetical protein